MRIVETKRLTIREANISDDDFFLDLMNSNGWLKFIGDRHIRKTADARAYILSLTEHYRNHGYGLFAVCDQKTAQPIGINGFLQRDYLKFPDLGFAFLPTIEGKGYGYESSMALLNYAKNAKFFSQVQAITIEENERSKKLLSKLGFTYQEIIQAKDEALLLYSIQL